MMMPTEAETEVAGSTSPFPLRVLIVEDNDDLRTIIRFVLETHGYEVDEAENGVQGLRHVEAFSPGAILLDMHMPVMDGRTFLRYLKDKGGRDARIPVIVLTACADGVIDGSVARLVKPFEMETLLLTLAQFSGSR